MTHLPKPNAQHNVHPSIHCKLVHGQKNLGPVCLS
uniref:Uncharacterized protein n=1 Tax=Arundo donax TaxID=35708 RepID=A0A0A9F913_ARUDO